ncbi:MAG: sugar phosphorylase [Anaerolineae bacterium]|nr:sugar phosphorylase [Anaerolineae bacterium]
MTHEAIKESIRQKLIRIYGHDAGLATYHKLESLLVAQESSSKHQFLISEKDVILICYADQVYDGQQAPLRVLNEFLKNTVHPTVNTVHLLPFYPSSSDDGFSVVDYYAVDEQFGTWEDIEALHRDFRLMFDAVFNHVSVSSAWFQKYLRQEAPYDGYFIEVQPGTDLSAVVRPRALPLLTRFESEAGPKYVWTTFSEDQVDLNLADPTVLLELIRVLLYYVAKGAEFIRLDAIAFLWKSIGTSCIHLEETHLIIQLMRDVLDIVAPQVVLITETNVPHAENLSYFGDGMNEAQMVYQFALPPLVLHTLHTGDATHLTAWAQSLSLPSQQTTFFNFTASHDGIGIRPVSDLLEQADIDALLNLTQEHGGHVSYKTNADGSLSPYELNITYFDAITAPPVANNDPELAVNRFMVSQAIQLSLVGIPGIYLHNLYGSRNWYAGVEQTGRYRSINREKLRASALEQELADVKSIRHQVFNRYMELLKIRTGSKAFHPLGAQRIHDLSPSVFAVERTSPDGSATVLALHNVTNEPVTCQLPSNSGWRNLMDQAAFDDTITLDPYQIAWLSATR